MSAPGEKLVTADEELFRQANPNFVQGETLTSQVFETFEKDHGLLSVARSAKTTAREAFERYVAQGYRSVGTVAVTVAEVTEVGLAAHDDVQPDDAAHAVIDFRGVSAGAARRARKELTRRAQVRGWRHRSG